MNTSLKTLAASATVILGVGVAAVSVSAAPSGASPAAPTSSSTAVFSQNLLGVSRFTQHGSSVSVKGLYSGLTPGNSYYTVVYGNSNCDPAQAFPVGYFTAGRRGFTGFSMTTTTTIPNLVSGTMSMSVRMADTAADLDQDGLTGPTDVVAVAGTPSIGLVECNSHPTVTNG